MITKREGEVKQKVNKEDKDWCHTAKKRIFDVSSKKMNRQRVIIVVW